MHVPLLRRSATPTARIRRYSLQGPGARGMSLLETSSSLNIFAYAMLFSGLVTYDLKKYHGFVGLVLLSAALCISQGKST